MKNTIFGLALYIGGAILAGGIGGYIHNKSIVKEAPAKCDCCKPECKCEPKKGKIDKDCDCYPCKCEASK